MGRAAGLLWCAHPMPTVAITTFTTALAVMAGAGSRSVLIGATVLTGQASIGWSNDYLDRHRDRAARRMDKPLVRGDVADRVVGAAAFIALAVSLVLSLAISTEVALINGVALAAGWSYNATLKRRWASPVPYLVHFALVPTWLVSASVADGSPPRVRLMVASSLLGISAHFANTIPDTAADMVTGVRGLPQRVGPVLSARLSAGLLFVSASILVAMSAGALSRILASAALTAAAVYAVLVVGPPAIRDRRVFTMNLVVISLLVGSFLSTGQRLAEAG